MKRPSDIQAILSGLTLEEKVGQVFMFGFHGRDPEGARHAICDCKAGGIIYFSRNMGDVSATHQLSSSLQEMAKEAIGLPLLISTDQEGGVVSRLVDGLPAMPGAMSLGASADPGLAEEVARATAIQLRSAGINVNLSPVLDVNDNPRNPVIGARSFGADPSLVAELGIASMRGYLAEDVLPVGKHFPGHGNTSVDSHIDLPIRRACLEDLEKVELRPFREAVLQGLPAIMTAHILFPTLDPLNPATMSHEILEDLLRRDLGFQGLIVTDCLEMDAVSKDPGVAEAAVRAFQAGADILLVSHTQSRQREAYEALLNAVSSGDVSSQRLDTAVLRIVAAKATMGIPNPLPAHKANTKSLRDLSLRAHLRGITAIRPTSGAESQPTADATPAIKEALIVPLAHLGGEFAPAKHLAKCLSALGIPAKEATPQETSGFASTVEGRVVIILTHNAWKDRDQITRAGVLFQAAPGALVVATGDPYDASLLPSAGAVFCTYSPRPEAMDALSLILAGHKAAPGKLPVALE